MRSRSAASDHVAEVARKRFELLSAELASARSQQAGGAASADSAGEPPLRPERPEPSVTTQAQAGHVGQFASVSPAVPGGKHRGRKLGWGSRVSAWVSDRLPPSLQGTVALGSSHVTVLVGLLAMCLGATAWWVMGANGSAETLPGEVTSQPVVASSPLVTADNGTPVPGSTAAGPSGGASPTAPPGGPATVQPAGGSGGSAAAPAGEGSAVIVVDVAGRVRQPGIVTLPPGSRVVDAVNAAGGPRPHVGLSSLNLARPLVDGEQIVVGTRAPVGVAASALAAPGVSVVPGPAALVNLNTAGETELETLPGVGPVTAQAILTWRTENGGFMAVDELMEVSGIGEATLAQIAPFATV